MKPRNIVGLTLALILVGVSASFAADKNTEAVRAALKPVPTAEVPARAAQLVGQASAEDRDLLTTEVVAVAVKAHPTIAPAIVGTIATQYPAQAVSAAASAARLQPKQAKAIAQAAAAAAPAHAGGIVKALCKIVPGAYREVASVVALIVPGATDEILAGLSEGLPAIKPALDTVIASYSGQVPSVGAVLDRVTTTPPVATGPDGVRGPTIGPPFIALSGTPTNTPPGGGTVPPGGRDYARP